MSTYLSIYLSLYGRVASTLRLLNILLIGRHEHEQT